MNHLKQLSQRECLSAVLKPLSNVSNFPVPKYESGRGRLENWSAGYQCTDIMILMLKIAAAKVLPQVYLVYKETQHLDILEEVEQFLR